MKCVGAEENGGTCQRCARSGAKCVFEKHRRGRKPGSKLSASSKLLREMEKGLRNAKKSHGDDPLVLPRLATYNEYDSHFTSNQLPPLNISEYPGPSSRPMDIDDDEEERNGEALFPAKMITKEKRNSYFSTILNHEDSPNHRASCSPVTRVGATSPPSEDPITTGIINDEDAKLIFDLIFLRLNPFVNLFDPALHTVNYVRSRCSFLFTVLIMAGSKFFRPEIFKRCQKLANDLRIRAFAEGWKSVEVVQAFACLTYWKEPDDNCTWTYIGYAARMAVELGLNRYVPHPPPHESDFQLRERRNRERTYLVLFVHDRSLSTQTGRNWMLPEDEIIQHSSSWHEEGGSTIRPEDVILAAFVQLRRIASETTDVFHTANRASRNGSHIDVNYEVVLRNCNGKLTQWMDHWKREMQRAGGSSFHISFLSYFRLYVRLFLNSFGIQNSISSTSHANPSVQALSVCYTSAIDSLRIVSKDFASLNLLRYGQETIIIMSAYSAVFLLKLLRSSSTLPQLHEGAAHEIHTAITQTADAFQEAASLSPTSTSSAVHSRFLRNLVANNDIFKSRGLEKGRYDVTIPQIDPRLQGSSSHSSSPSSTQGYSQPSPGQSFHFPASPHLPAHPIPRENEYTSEVRSSSEQLSPPTHTLPTINTELDAQYWRNMFLGLGFGSLEPPVVGTLSSGEGYQNHSSYHHMHPSSNY